MPVRGSGWRPQGDTPSRRIALAVCLAACAIGASPAGAATTYGGYSSTPHLQPIVITADAYHQKALTVVFSWYTSCDDPGRHDVFDAAELTLKPGAPGSGATLGTSRN